MDILTLALIFGIAIIFLFIFLYFVPVNLWITAIFSGVRIELFELVFMRIRKTPPSLIINNLILMNKAGISITTAELETHYLAGGNVEKMTRAMISAKNSGQDLTWKEAAAIDLSGKDIEYTLRKIKLEKDGGIDQLRNQLSSAMLNDLDTDELKEVARVVENMKSFRK